MSLKFINSLRYTDSCVGRSNCTVTHFFYLYKSNTDHITLMKTIMEHLISHNAGEILVPIKTQKTQDD